MQRHLCLGMPLVAIVVVACVCIHATAPGQTGSNGSSPSQFAPSRFAPPQFAPNQFAPPVPYANGLSARPPIQPVPAVRPKSWPGAASSANGWNNSNASAPPHPAPTQPYPPPTQQHRNPVGYPPPYPPNNQAHLPPTQPLPPYGDPARPPHRTARLAPPIANPQPSGVGPMVPCEAAQPIAVVGKLTILACEVSGRVNELLEKNKARIPAHQLEAQRKLLTQQLLNNLIKTKLIYNDARRTIPEESFPQVEKSLAEQFDKVELKNMMKRAKVETRQELEALLLSMGSSLQREKRAFAERILAQQWIRQKTKPKGEITVDQMWTYYNEHVADFQTSGRVRWQQLTARFSKHSGKQAAYAAIGRMGNRVLARVPMDQVAKAESNGATASNGGWRDWTTQDSLVSETLNQALFELPAGQLSPILEDATGYHIVRVIEREDASQTPFPDAQADIRPKITQRRAQEQMQAYLAKLRKNTSVWTIFDEPDDQRITNRPDRRRW